MQEIKTIEELRQLQPKQKFWVVTGGSNIPYNFCCPNPMHENLAVAVKNGNITDAVVFSNLSFRGNTVFLTGEYNSVIIASYMIDQLNDQVNSIQKIYLKRDKHGS